MSADSITYLTDAVLVTVVVTAGRADDVLKAARAVGAAGGFVHLARGTGARERLGLLGITVEAEKEVITLVVPADFEELLCATVYRAGGLGTPGSGFLYVTPIERLATYVPDEALQRLAGQQQGAGDG